jgi:hypothetical protein
MNNYDIISEEEVKFYEIVSSFEYRHHNMTPSADMIIPVVTMI